MASAISLYHDTCICGGGGGGRGRGAYGITYNVRQVCHSMCGMYIYDMYV